LIIDITSDLHGHYPKLEGGDLLIVAGDLTARDTPEEHCNVFCKWVESQPYKKIIVIAGNHDTLLQKDECLSIGDYDGIKTDYLCDSGTEFHYFDDRFPKEDTGFLPSGDRTLKIWGSPWTLWFKGINPNCTAFTLKTEEELADKWALIPDDIDILVTHSPPNGILDVVRRKGRDELTGSISLRNHVMGRIKPRIHCFGHIHEWGGQVVDTSATKFVNASHVNEKYQPINKPIRIEL
jgi:Icc-related predicted phosphoesterase